VIQAVPDPLARNGNSSRIRRELRAFVEFEMSRRHDGASPDDVVQETLLRALTVNVEAGLGHPARRVAWLCGVARNVIREHGRRTTAGVASFSDLGPDQLEGIRASAGESWPSERLEKEEESGAVVAAVSELPQPEREIVWSRFMDGWSVPEIAKARRVDLEACKSQLRRALLTVRRAVSQRREGGE
jgi:RNA polymerase sigma-70 factor (ECF subfamily)